MNTYGRIAAVALTVAGVGALAACQSEPVGEPMSPDAMMLADAETHHDVDNLHAQEETTLGEEVRTRLDEIRVEVESLQTQAGHLAADARIEIERQIERLQEEARELRQGITQGGPDGMDTTTTTMPRPTRDEQS